MRIVTQGKTWILVAQSKCFWNDFWRVWFYAQTEKNKEVIEKQLLQAHCFTRTAQITHWSLLTFRDMHCNKQDPSTLWVTYYSNGLLCLEGTELKRLKVRLKHEILESRKAWLMIWNPCSQTLIGQFNLCLQYGQIITSHGQFTNFIWKWYSIHNWHSIIKSSLKKVRKKTYIILFSWDISFIVIWWIVMQGTFLDIYSLIYIYLFIFDFYRIDIINWTCLKHII